MQHIQHTQQGRLPKASRGFAAFLHSTPVKSRLTVCCSATNRSADAVNAAKLHGILPLVALATCTQLALPVSGDVVQAAPATESSLQTTGYVRIERRKLENLLVKQFKASLSELSDEELAVLFEDVILSKRITAADMLQPASRNSENNPSSNSTPIRDISPPRSTSADRSTSARQQETEPDTSPQQPAQPSKPSNSWAASLGFGPDYSQAPDVVDTNPVQQDKQVPSGPQRDTFTAPWSRQPAANNPDTAAPLQGKGVTASQETPTVNSQQNNSGNSIDKKTQESDIAQVENEEGVDPTLQLLQQLMSQSTQNEKKQGASPTDTNQSADKDTGRNAEDDSWFSNPLSSVLDQLPSAPQLPSLPELPNVGEALSFVGAASQQVLAGAAAVTGAVSETVSEGLELNGRAQAALGLGGIAITVATVALLMEAKQQPDDTSVSSNTLGSQAQTTDSSTDDESNQNTASLPKPKEAVAGASASSTSSKAESASGSDTEQKSRENTPSKRPVSPTGRRGALDMQKLLDNGPVLSPPPPPVLPSSVMNGGLPIDPTYNPQGNTMNSVNGNSGGGILWQRQASTNNQPPVRRTPMNLPTPQWDNGPISNGGVENTSNEQNRAQAGWNSNSKVEPPVGTYQVPSDPWDPNAIQQDSNGLPPKQQQQQITQASSWPPSDSRTAGASVEERLNARTTSQLPSPWDS